MTRTWQQGSTTQKAWVAAAALATLVTGGCTNGDAEPANPFHPTPIDVPPLDLEPYWEDPCAVLPAKDAVALGFDPDNGGEVALSEEHDAVACQLLPPGTEPYPRDVATLTFYLYLSPDVHNWGQQDTKVAGYPASIFHDEGLQCTLWAAVSEEHAFFVLHRAGKPSDCDIARAGAEAIIENLRAGR